MGYPIAHAPIYGYLKGYKHTVPLQLVHYARTFSIFKLLNTLELGRVLNVGGADGYQSYLLKQIFNADVMTADINSHTLNLAQQKYGLEVCNASALDLPFADNSFDTVIMIETIEHIMDSAKVIAELRRVARKHIVISTESFFDSEEQKEEFLLYLHETHPQFFRQNNPVQRSDVSYFTKKDFTRLFDNEPLRFYPQFSHKQTDILGPIEAIRSHVKAMTENLSVSKQTKVIVHYCKGEFTPRGKTLPESDLLETIVSDKPLFPIELDAEMIQEDRESVQRLEKYNSEASLCKIVEPNKVPLLPIEEEGAEGMALQWLTKDDNERSPSFCTRKITLEKSGTTPLRKTAWEHQIYILSGSALLFEESRETELSEGMTVLIRPNIPFRIRNMGQQPLSFLDIVPSITHFFGR
ncbi:methyltransferase domain-containing protein [Pseudodesulfovibrio sp.]|uniref:methyltransferase domain-containing protein n=1 Tax=unclassified Pseudodesulfovibrio TaxID=2661612 RepID=UPI003AFF6218